MALMDALFQQLSTVNDNTQPAPPTIASAGTITPTTFLTFITGAVQIATINPPATGAHMLCFVFTGAAPGAFILTGNIKNAVTATQNVPMFAVYDPITALYWMKA